MSRECAWVVKAPRLAARETFKSLSRLCHLSYVIITRIIAHDFFNLILCSVSDFLDF